MRGKFRSNGSNGITPKVPNKRRVPDKIEPYIGIGNLILSGKMVSKVFVP